MYITQNGDTPLLVSRGSVEVVQVLLDSGADKDARNHVRMGLMGPVPSYMLGAICMMSCIVHDVD